MRGGRGGRTWENAGRSGWSCGQGAASAALSAAAAALQPPAWENGYFMNGRAAAARAHAPPPDSMNGWAPRRQRACSAAFYEWGLEGSADAVLGCFFFFPYFFFFMNEGQQ